MSHYRSLREEERGVRDLTFMTLTHHYQPIPPPPRTATAGPALAQPLSITRSMSKARQH